MGILDGFFGMFRRAPARDTADVAAAPPAAPAAKSPAVHPVAAKPAAAKPTASVAVKAPTKTAVSAQAKAPPKAIPQSASGPLRLATGDHVTRYRERFTVVGSRYFEGAGRRTWHYCLRDASGGSAVLVAPEGDDAVCSIQRPIKGDVRWDADVLTDAAASGPLKVVRRGKAKVRGWDDAGPATASGTVEFRDFEDADGERVASLEDYDGRREARAGDPVFESELTFERAAEDRAGGVFSAAAQRAGAFEDVPDGDIVKGSPRAAARVLDQNVGATKPKSGGAAVDHDPTAYDDDAWADTDDAVPTVAARGRASPSTPQPAAQTQTGDEDEWTSAAQLIRGTPDSTT
jgi:hypothetical protein